ncbi:hypothetical protein GCM10022380_46480 [Amycolatopsis tucumanensis]|uniref:Transposase n=1 Tax=Amycolatopsis tucumanensis TaxID=401106 RepID=A0ABP7IN33_9PSEU
MPQVTQMGFMWCDATRFSGRRALLLLRYARAGPHTAKRLLRAMLPPGAAAPKKCGSQPE